MALFPGGGVLGAITINNYLFTCNNCVKKLVKMTGTKQLYVIAVPNSTQNKFLYLILLQG